MDCKYQLKDGCMRISMPREVDHHCAEQLRREADLLIGAYHIRRLVFDFKRTEFMDSSGIGVILGRCRNVSLAGGQALAVHLNEQVKKIFCMSGLQKVISIEA